ncbi:MAG: VanW family protein [Bacillota bacterium]
MVKRLAALFLIVSVQTAFAVLLGGSILSGHYGGTIIPGVVSGGLDLGGLSPAQAVESLRERFGAAENVDIVIEAEGRRWTIPMKSIGASYDYGGAVEKAYAVGHTGSLTRRISEILGSKAVNTDIALPLKFDQEALKNQLAVINGQHSVNSRNARLVVEGSKVRLVPGLDGHEMDISGTVERISSLRAGMELKATAVFRAVSPGINDKDLSGLTDVLGECVTRFEAGSAARANNITLAAGKIDGVLVKPAEVFSFNSVLGAVDEKNGYLKAPVISDGQLVDDFGGGICQVSTTLYGAALLSGFEIVERYPHSKPVKYVPPGLDVTVSEGQKDFRFKNNLDRAVYIHSTTGPEDGYVKVVIIGKKQGNTVYRIDSEVRAVSPGIVLRGSQSLLRGETVVASEGSPGYEALIYRVSVTEGGEEKREFISRDYYSPDPKILDVGM